MKVFATLLAIGLGLWVCGTASAAAQDLRNPDQVAPAPATHQDLRNPDQVAPDRGQLQDLRNPDRVAPEPAIVTGSTTAPSVASADAIPAPDAGFSTLLIVLISTGAALAAAGAYATMRVAHARAAS